MLAIVVAVTLPLVLTAAAAAAKKPKSGKPGPVLTATVSTSGSGNLQIVTATATCPKGTRAVGGGFSATPPTVTGDHVNPNVYESRKVGQNAWRVSLQIGDGDVPTNVSLTTSAYCRRGVPATRLASLVTQLPASNGISPVTPVICDAKTKATGGGFARQPPVIIPAGSATGWVLESYLGSPTSWVNRSVTSANGPGVLTSEAYCAKFPAKKGKKSASASKKGKGLRPPTASFATGPPTAAETGAPATATASCKSRSVIGGGYRQPTALFPGPPTRSAYPFESQRNGSTWRVSAITVVNEAITFDSMALCG